MAKGGRLLSLAVHAEHKKRIQFKSLSSSVELELGRKRFSCLCSQVHGVVLLSTAGSCCHPSLLCWVYPSWDSCLGKTEGLCSVNWKGSWFIPGQWPVSIFVG